MKPRINFNLLLETPSLYHKLCTRFSISIEELDQLMLDNDPVHTPLYLDYCDTYILRYGLYPVSGGTVSLRRMCEDADLPLALAGCCAMKLGSAEDILKILRVPYFNLFGTVIARSHFYREFKIKDIDAFEKAVEDNAGNVEKACARLKIRACNAYARQSAATEKHQESVEKAKAKSGRPSAELKEYLDNNKEPTYESRS